MSEDDKRELEKEILLEEHESKRELDLYVERLRGNHEDFKKLADHLSLLIMYLSSGTYQQPARAKEPEETFQLIAPYLKKYGLNGLDDSCKQALDSKNRLLTAIQRKREAGMI